MANDQITWAEHVKPWIEANRQAWYVELCSCIDQASVDGLKLDFFIEYFKQHSILSSHNATQLYSLKQPEVKTEVKTVFVDIGSKDPQLLTALSKVLNQASSTKEYLEKFREEAYDIIFGPKSADDRTKETEDYERKWVEFKFGDTNFKKLRSRLASLHPIYYIDYQILLYRAAQAAYPYEKLLTLTLGVIASADLLYQDLAKPKKV